MKLDKFFKELDFLYKGIENKNNVKIACKYFISPVTFSYNLTIFKDGFFNFLRPDYKSDVIYFWKDDLDSIIKEIKNRMKNYEIS